MPDESLEKNFIFLDKVSYIELTFIGSDGKEQTILHGFDLLSGIRLPKIAWGENILYLAIALALLLVMLYMLKKEKKPKSKKGQHEY